MNSNDTIIEYLNQFSAELLGVQLEYQLSSLSASIGDFNDLKDKFNLLNIENITPSAIKNLDFDEEFHAKHIESVYSAEKSRIEEFILKNKSRIDSCNQYLAKFGFEKIETAMPDIAVDWDALKSQMSELDFLNYCFQYDPSSELDDYLDKLTEDVDAAIKKLESITHSSKQ